MTTGKPVSSQSLREFGLEEMSSSTIRNYFSQLETRGLLQQIHSSGGRVPTEAAFSLYASACWEQVIMEDFPEEEGFSHSKGKDEEREEQILSFLQREVKALSNQLCYPVFLSSPQFKQDFVAKVRWISIDEERIAAILVTHLGWVKTEIFQVEPEVGQRAFLQKLEEYCTYRLQKGDLSLVSLSKAERERIRELYNEVMIRYLMNYSSSPREKIHRIGLSSLLNYPEFATWLKSRKGLILFEREEILRKLIREVCALQKMKWWMGSHLQPFCTEIKDCVVIATPYRMNQTIIGVVGLWGPMRMAYEKIFSLLEEWSRKVSRTLTHRYHKFCIEEFSSHPASGNALSFLER